MVEESLQLLLHLLLLLLHSLSVCGLEPHWIEPPFDGMVHDEGNHVFRLRYLLAFHALFSGLCVLVFDVVFMFMFCESATILW